MMAFSLLLGLLLDIGFKEVARFHPLVGFAAIASFFEKRLNQQGLLKLKGLLAWCLAVVPWVLLAFFLQKVLAGNAFLNTVFAAGVLYFAIGWQSLLQHAKVVTCALKVGDVSLAREKVAMIVSRECEKLDAEQVAKACSESVLENGADAIFAPIFWFVVLGPSAVVLYRLANTLDAMWGYKNSRFKHFGFAAAKIDDALNFIPARLCALSYLLLGNSQQAWQSIRGQAPHYQSPNAGPVMAAGAGSLELSLGGVAYYHGEKTIKPLLGVPENKAKFKGHKSIDACCNLVNKSLFLWVLVIVVAALL